MNTANQIQIIPAYAALPLPIAADFTDVDYELDIVNELVAVIRHHAFLFANEIEADVPQHLETAFDDIYEIMAQTACPERCRFAFQVVHSILFPA